MKLTNLTLALSAVFALPAFAADLTYGVPAGNILYLSGTPAVTGALKSLLEHDACDTRNGATFAIYTDDTYYYDSDNTDDERAFVYTCSKAKAGSSWNYGFAAGSRFIVVKREDEGTYAAVGPAGVGPVVNKVALGFPNLKNCSATTAACAMGGSMGPGVKIVPQAGFTDVDVNVWKGLGLFTPSTKAYTTKNNFLFQGFGVAVSNNLYSALQVSQGLSGCEGNFTSATCQPSISKTEYASIVAKVGDFHQSWEPILGAAGIGKAVNLCRSQLYTGTQAASDLYFLNNPCAMTTTTAGYLQPATRADSVPDKFIVTENPITRYVMGCLNRANRDSHFAIGVISLRHLPWGEKYNQWHFVKLDGVSPNFPNFNPDGSYNDKQNATVISGDYEFAYEMQALYRNDASQVLKGFMNGVVKYLSNPGLVRLVGMGQVPGLRINADAPTAVAKVTRDGEACRPFRHIYY